MTRTVLLDRKKTIALMLNSEYLCSMEVSDYTAVAVPTSDDQFKWQPTTFVPLVQLNRFTDPKLPTHHKSCVIKGHTFKHL